MADLASEYTEIAKELVDRLLQQPFTEEQRQLIGKTIRITAQAAIAHLLPHLTRDQVEAAYTVALGGAGELWVN
jgi:hypothetical protein